MPSLGITDHGAGAAHPDRAQARLSAILAADVAGHSRLMHNDEEATHAKLTALVAEAVAPAIAETVFVLSLGIEP